MTANVTDPSMDSAIKAAKSVANEVAQSTTKNTDLVSQFDKVVTTAHNLQSNVDGRLLWLELLKAIDSALPKDTRPPDKRQETEDDIAKREELHIEGIECEFMPDITSWQASIQKWYTPSPKPAAPATPAPAAGQAADATAPAGVAGSPAPGTPPAGQTAATPAPAPAPDAAATPPADAAAGAAATNSGWIIELRGYHLHNSVPSDEGEEFLKRTIIKNLELGKVTLPDGPNGKLVDVPIADLGIKLPVVVTHPKIQSVTYYAEVPDSTGPGAGPARPPVPEAPGMLPGGTGQAAEQQKMFKLRKYRFVIQFCWQPQPRGQRIEKMTQKKAAEPGTAAVGAETIRPSS